MNQLVPLFTEGHQSPWLDNLRRDWLHNGHLATLIERGVRGITSNPTIFMKAITTSSAYDEQFANARAKTDTLGAYWELVTRDITDALGLLAPLHKASNGLDGYVSLEVDPRFAHDAANTVAQGRELARAIGRPNLMIKVPATVAGLDAIETLISEGHSINVTLIFSVDRYDQVVESYLRGLERRLDGGVSDLSDVASVASFFVSRVDTEIDRRLGGLDGGSELQGRAAVAQAKVAYAHFEAAFDGPRWERLEAAGASVQRPLWASTSTKNPSYDELLYVNSLIGPNTVNTLPDPTLEAFDDHGTVAVTITNDTDEAAALLESLRVVGVDLDDVAAVLEREGVASFEASFVELLDALDAKATN